MVFAMSFHIGCESKMHLAEIAGPSLTLFVPEAPGTATVTVLPREQDIRLEGPCKLPAPKARATLNGVALARRRGKHVGDDMSYDRDCIVEFGVAAERVRKAGPGMFLELWDGSVAWKLEVPTAFAPRTFELLTPADAIVRPGARVTVRWSPSSDRIDGRSLGFELYRAESAPGTGITIREVDVRGDTLSFSIPSQAEQSGLRGAALLRVLGTYGVKPASSHCPVHNCSVTIAFNVPALAVTLED
jgi:hypothetical protein